MSGGNEGDSKMPSDEIQLILGLIQESGMKLSFNEAFSRLDESLSKKGIDNHHEVAKQVLNQMLDAWTVDKVIDYASDDSDQEYEWFLTILSEDEAKRLKNLSEEEKAFLKILRNSEVDGRLGVMAETDALKALSNAGHDVDFVPFIAGKTDEFVRSTDDGKAVVWHYLVPQYELRDINEE
jgi:hypothetical protein